MKVRLVPAGIARNIPTEVREAETDAEGFFRFTDVFPGKYVVHLVYPGSVYFTTSPALEVELKAGTVVEVEFGVYPAYLMSRRLYIPMMLQK